MTDEARARVVWDTLVQSGPIGSTFGIGVITAAFAAVRAEEHAEIISLLARSVSADLVNEIQPYLDQFAYNVRAEERERCATIAEDTGRRFVLTPEGPRIGISAFVAEIAAAIRRA